jgi:hypothetical protein
MVGFYAFMTSHAENFPARGPIFQRVILLFEARKAGKAWFARRDHRMIGAVAFAIAVWGFIFAAVSGNATDFGRSGALISMLGLVVAFIGSIHARGLLELRHAVAAAAASRDKPETDERAEGLSRVWMAVIIAIGTLIWGYGDLAFDALNGRLCKLGVSWVKLGCPATVVTPPPPPLSPPPTRLLVFFDWNSVALQSAAEGIIWQAARDAMKDTNALVHVVGRADTSGSPEYNLRLSECRANAVRSELLKLGLNPNAVIVSSKGSNEPIVSSGNKTREALNRNVEIVIERGSTSTGNR